MGREERQKGNGKAIFSGNRSRRGKCGCMYGEGATVGMRLEDETFFFFFFLFPVVSPATFLSARCRFVVTLPTEPAQRPFLKL